MKPLSIECPNLTCIINQSWPGCAAEGHLPVKSKEIDPNQAKALFLTDAQFVAKNWASKYN